MNDLRLKGKVALVTGGMSGIGRAISALFVQNGANVVVVDRVKQDESDFENTLIKVKYMRLDISSESSWVSILEYIQSEHGKLDILVNSAGITGIEVIQDPENMSLETWRHIYLTNLDSIFLGCKYAIRLMKNSDTGCSIVNLSSRSGMVAVPNLSAYASSKAAIINYTKSVAIYCAQNEYNIRCNSIIPASIDTPMWDHLRSNPSKFEKYVSSLPLKRMGTDSEVAYAALYLASDESSYTTGSEITVDGGILSVGAGLPK